MWRLLSPFGLPVKLESNVLIAQRERDAAQRERDATRIIQAKAKYKRDINTARELKVRALAQLDANTLRRRREFQSYQTLRASFVTKHLFPLRFGRPCLAYQKECVKISKIDIFQRLFLQ